MNHEEFRRLLRSYAENTCSDQEREYLERLVLTYPLTGNWDWSSEEQKVLMQIRIKNGIDLHIRRSAQQKTRRLWTTVISIAASLLLITGITWLLLPRVERPENQEVVISESTPQHKDGVVLTLADGSSIQLDSLNGEVIPGAGTQVSKHKGDQLVYEHTGSDEKMSALRNSIWVPNGKQFELVLADGTKVWLNTASKLSYPVAFNGKDRRVTLEGEAYFEVAHNKKMPFIVEANETEIVVTGTHFNVSAYPSDQSVKTTLFKGGVDVHKEDQKVSLTPGYQALTHLGKSEILKQHGDLEQALAWKNGYFVFDNMDLVAVMKSVARWYDITVTMDRKKSMKRIGGTFPVTANLDDLLADLELLSGIKFKRTGKEVKIIW